MLRFPIPRPRSSDATILPAALAAVLGGMLVLQLALVRSEEPDVDSVSAAATGRGASVPVIAAVAPEAVIRERPIFTPARVVSSGGPGDALGGAQVSGAWAVGRRVNLVLRQPNGGTRTIQIGQAVNEWVLASITPDGARFSRDGKTMLVPFGSSTAPPAASAENETEEGQ